MATLRSPQLANRQMATLSPRMATTLNPLLIKATPSPLCLAILMTMVDPQVAHPGVPLGALPLLPDIHHRPEEAGWTLYKAVLYGSFRAFLRPKIKQTVFKRVQGTICFV